MLLKYKTCYATQKNDVGKISSLFRIRLKSNAQLITQRPSKVPIHYRDKLNALLEELEKQNIKNKSVFSTRQTSLWYITIHMPQKWSLSSSVMCIIRKTRTNRILVKQCNMFIMNCDAQCNQKLRIVVIERNQRKVETSQEFQPTIGSIP